MAHGSIEDGETDTHIVAPIRAPLPATPCLLVVAHTPVVSKLRTFAPWPLALLAACFSEAPPIPDEHQDTSGDSTDPSDADSGTAPTSDPTTASMSSTDPSSSDSNSASASTSVSTTADPSDTTIEPETEEPPCGAMGESCCDGSACDEGACLLGRCVAFAGAFMDGEQCADCPSVLQALQCGCPEGFELGPALPLLSSGCIKDTPDPWTDESVFACQASTYVPGVSDWGGAYVRNDPDAPCGGVSECVVANPYTRECDCPPESTPVEAVVYGHCDGDIPDPPPAFRLGICVGNGEPLTFGGAVYSEGPTCLVPHPETGTCDCPEEFTRSTMRVISQAQPNMAGDFGFCVRAP